MQNDTAEEKITNVKRAGNFIASFLLGNTRDLIIRTDEKVAGLEKTMIEVKGDIKDMKTLLYSHGKEIVGLQVHTKYGTSNSPTVPSDLGKKLLKDSGFDAQYPLLKDKLFTLMDTMSLRTPYDYEVGSLKALNNLINDPLIDPLKNHALSNPDESLELIFKVASWVIRDDYAEYKKGG